MSAHRGRDSVEVKENDGIGLPSREGMTKKFEGATGV